MMSAVWAAAGATSGAACWSTPARRAGERRLWEVHGTLLVGVRAFAAHASARQRTWKRESVGAPPCMWELGRFGASLLGTSWLTPCNELPA